jgi:glycosyltransferase involved in cell wall biosynthesis
MERDRVGDTEAAGTSRAVHLTTVHRPFDPRIFHKQLKSLRDAGFDVHLVAPHDRAERRDGVALHPLPTGRRRWAERLPLLPLAYRRARALDADLYQIHDPELIPVARLLKKATGARIVYDMHENYRTKGPFWGRVLRALEHWGFEWMDHVLLAERSYRSVVAGRVPSTCILNYVTPIGEASREPPRSSSSGPTRLLYTGTVSDRRGLSTMLDLAAAAQRRGRPVRLDLVGVCNHPEQRRGAERRIQREGLHRTVTWVGGDRYVPPSEMPPYYRRADVGLCLCAPHPNLRESILTKFYEYLHYGLPIICSDVPLWRQFVEENECGVVVPPGTVTPVLDVLRRWREHPDRYRQYARNARAAASTYRWEQMGARLVKLYRERLLPDEGTAAPPDPIGRGG